MKTYFDSYKRSLYLNRHVHFFFFKTSSHLIFQNFFSKDVKTWNHGISKVQMTRDCIGYYSSVQSSQLFIEQVYFIHVTTALSRWITISFIKLNIRRYNKHCTSSYIGGSVCCSHVENSCMIATFHQDGGVWLREITPPHCIEVLVPSQVGEWVFMPMCVHVPYEVSIFACFYDVPIRLWSVFACGNGTTAFSLIANNWLCYSWISMLECFECFLFANYWKNLGK